MDDCVFCKIIKREIVVELLYRDEDVVVFESNQPVADHHLLIVPIKHTPTFLDLETEIVPMLKAAKKMIYDRKIDNGYKLAFNGGIYQSVGHVHWHLLGGKLEDDNDILNRT